MVDESQCTPLGTLGNKEATDTLHQEVLEGVAVPYRMKRHRSVESGGTLGRQDSIVPILKR
jgi:hypothetical protein